MTQATLNLVDQGVNGDFRVYKGSYWQIAIELKDETGFGWQPLANFDELLFHFRSCVCYVLFEDAPVVAITAAVDALGDFVSVIRLSFTATASAAISATSGNWEILGRTLATAEITTRPFFRGTWAAVEQIVQVGDSPWV